MTTLLSRPEYERQIAATRAARMAWWHDARYGMFVHFGAHTLLGRNEWVQAIETGPSTRTRRSRAVPTETRCTRAWAKLAAEAGMKYMVLTTRHHEGFCLWDSKTNPTTPWRTRAGSTWSRSLWRHAASSGCASASTTRSWTGTIPTPGGAPSIRPRGPGSWTSLRGCSGSSWADYGKIDILWYDVSRPRSHEGWESLAMNQMARDLQPDIIINNRSSLDEDFSTPEELQAAEEGKAGRPA